MSRRVMVRELEHDEETRLLQIVRRGGNGSVLTWRRAQMVLLSAQGMDCASIAHVAFTTSDRVRDVLHDFNHDGLESLNPHYAGGRPVKFTTEQRARIKNLALDHPTDYGLPFSTWSLSKLADFLVAKGVVEEISPEGLRVLLREQGVSFPMHQDLETKH